MVLEPTVERHLLHEMGIYLELLENSLSAPHEGRFSLTARTLKPSSCCYSVQEPSQVNK